MTICPTTSRDSRNAVRQEWLIVDFCGQRVKKDKIFPEGKERGQESREDEYFIPLQQCA